MTPDDQLLATFSAELESLLTLITDNLNKIEPSESMSHLSPMMEEISRAGRNIKVSAFSVGIDDLGKMAEYIEKLFEPSQSISLALINLGFHAVDGMRETLHDFIEKNHHPRSFMHYCISYNRLFMRKKSKKLNI